MEAKKIVRTLVEYSPHALLFSMLMTFLIAGTFQAGRLNEHGVILAVAIAVTTQIIRLASGLTSAEFFRRKETGKAILVLVFSLSVTIFETMTEVHPEILMMIWAGFFLEIFLGLSVKN